MLSFQLSYYSYLNISLTFVSQVKTIFDIRSFLNQKVSGNTKAAIILNKRVNFAALLLIYRFPGKSSLAGVRFGSVSDELVMSGAAGDKEDNVVLMRADEAHHFRMSEPDNGL